MHWSVTINYIIVYLLRYKIFDLLRGDSGTLTHNPDHSFPKAEQVAYTKIWSPLSRWLMTSIWTLRLLTFFLFFSGHPPESKI